MRQHILHNRRTPSASPPSRALSPPSTIQPPFLFPIRHIVSILSRLFRIHKPGFPETIHRHLRPLPFCNGNSIFINFEQGEIREKQFRGLDFLAYAVEEAFFSEELDDHAFECIGELAAEKHFYF